MAHKLYEILERLDSRFIGTDSPGAKLEGSEFVSDDLEAIFKLIDPEGNGPQTG